MLSPFSIPAKSSTVPLKYILLRGVEVVNKSNLDIVKGLTNNGSVACYAKQVITDEKDSKLSKTEDEFVLYTDNEDVVLIQYLSLIY